MISKKFGLKNEEKFDSENYVINQDGSNVTILHSRTDEEQKNLIERMKKARIELPAEISIKINELIKIIEKNNPLLILQFISGKYQILDIENYKESTEKRLEIYGEYTQSIIASCTKFDFSKTPDEKILNDFERIIKDVVKLIEQYFMFEFADKCSSDISVTKQNFLRFKSIMNHIYLRGDSFDIHEKEMMDELFDSHSVFFFENYGFSYEDIKNCINEIENTITGYYNSLREYHKNGIEIHSIYKNWVVEQNNNLSIEELMVDFNKLPEVISFKNKIEEGSTSSELGLLSPQKEVYIKILAEISLKLGENKVFKGHNPYWVINESSIYRKPLIKYNESYYCYFFNILVRNLKHILESLIREKDEKYYHEKYLKNGRDKYLENKAAEYFKIIFPNAIIYQNLTYSYENKKYETDLLICYNRYLFIVESKAGSLSDSSKRGSLVAIQKDSKKIIENAYKQALRTKKYINSKEKVEFGFRKTNVILIEKANYDDVFLVNTTFDKLNFLSSELNDLKAFNIDFGEEKFWSVFINDLRIISELIESPSLYILYLERRIKLFSSPSQIEDEMDAFMFFLDHGLYFKEEDFEGVGNYGFLGYTDKLDRYYLYKQGLVKSGEKPSFNITKEFKQIAKTIEESNQEYSVFVAKSILGLDYKLQSQILRNIKEIHKLYIRDKKVHCCTYYSKDENIGLLISIGSNDSDFVEYIDLEQHCRIKMEQSRFNKFIVLKFKKHIDYNKVKFNVYLKSDSDVEVVDSQLQDFRYIKLNQYLKTHKKIGRNELCPCGSGLKYKKCCLKRP